jgi:competence protein ComGC
MARVFSKRHSYSKVKMLIFAALLILIILAVWSLTDLLGGRHSGEQMKIAQDAVIRATVQCYSLEGRYPPSLDYLVENYGLTLYEDKYIYYYQPVGENLMPDIRLMPVGGTGGDLDG